MAVSFAISVFHAAAIARGEAALSHVPAGPAYACRRQKVGCRWPRLRNNTALRIALSAGTWAWHAKPYNASRMGGCVLMFTLALKYFR